MSLSSRKTFSITVLISFISVLMGSQLAGCAGDSYASKGAAQGAAQGAAAGAVGGLVSALVFGGDPVDRAARGAVYGGATGAVAGGMAGSRKDKQVQTQAQAQQDAELEALRKEIGRPAFNGLAALADCQHQVSLQKAKKAQQAKNPNYRLAGIWLEVLNYADLRQQDRVNKLLPVIVAEDWDITSETQAAETTRQAAAELITIRKEFGLTLVCPA